MSLESIYFISQTIAVVLLLVSVVFVGIQIRHNTRATQAASVYDVMKTWGLFNYELAKDPGSLSVLHRAVDLSASFDDFEELEQAQIVVFTRSLFQLWMSQYFLYKEGSLAKEHWEMHGRFAANFVKLPTISTVLEQETLTGIMTAELAAELSRLGQLHKFDLSALRFKNEPT